jgi:hypothetical protein
VSRDETHELICWQVVTAATIQLGDKVNLEGRHRTVADMFRLHGNGKRLVFEDGGTHCLGEVDTLYAYRAPD